MPSKDFLRLIFIFVPLKFVGDEEERFMFVDVKVGSDILVIKGKFAGGGLARYD